MGFELDADDIDVDDKEPESSIPVDVISRFGAIAGELARQYANRLQLELAQEFPKHARLTLVRAVSDATAVALQAARDARGR